MHHLAACMPACLHQLACLLHESVSCFSCMLTLYSVQACARQVLGLEDVNWPAYYHEFDCQHCCHAHGACTGYGLINNEHVCLPPAPARWAHERGYNQWFIDAFKIDPAKLMEEEYGIWERGVEQPVQEVSVHNASPGSVPTLTAFIAVHAKLGTRIYFPKLACGGGHADSWDDFTWWTTWLTDEEKERIKRRCYYNMDSALRGCQLPRVREQMQEAAFCEQWFLVSSSSLNLQVT